MPALRLFGRRWHISSDDLPPFTLPGAAFHYTWAVFLTAALAIEPGACFPSPEEGGGEGGDPSGSTAALRGFLAAMLAVDVLQACALAWLTHVGLRGEPMSRCMHARGLLGSDRPLVNLSPACGTGTPSVKSANIIDQSINQSITHVGYCAEQTTTDSVI